MSWATPLPTSFLYVVFKKVPLYFHKMSECPNFLTLACSCASWFTLTVTVTLSGISSAYGLLYGKSILVCSDGPLAVQKKTPTSSWVENPLACSSFSSDLVLNGGAEGMSTILLSRSIRRSELFISRSPVTHDNDKSPLRCSELNDTNVTSNTAPISVERKDTTTKTR